MTVRHLEVQVTCGSEAEADRLATVFVEQRLAACVHQFPIRSTYRWEATIQRDDEIVLRATTTSDRLEAIAAVVAELHSYDVPAVTAVPIIAGSTPFLSWVDDETQPG